MSKLLFLVITIICLMVLYFVSGYIAVAYLFSDYFVPVQGQQSGSEETAPDGAMPIEEFLERYEAGTLPEFEDPNQQPVEILMLGFNSFILRIFVFSVAVVLSIFSALVIKNNRIDFSVMALDSSERVINVIRISMYMLAVYIAYISARAYTLAFLLGWVRTLLWIINILAIMVWVLNIIYAFKERKKNKIRPAKI